VVEFDRQSLQLGAMRCSTRSSSSSSCRTSHYYPGTPRQTKSHIGFCTRLQVSAAEAAGGPAVTVPFALRNPASAEESALPPGKCWLAGVGPGSWDHVTVGAVYIISFAAQIACSGSRLLGTTARGNKQIAQADLHTDWALGECKSAEGMLLSDAGVAVTAATCMTCCR
jgi:hypothetical protein